MTLNVPQNFLSESEDTWLEAVDKALKGASRSTLYGKTEEGLEIAPLYPRRPDAKPRRGRPAQTPWCIFQRTDMPDPVQANRQIREDLEGGANGLDLTFSTARNTDEGQGLRLDTLSDMETLFDGVYLDLIQLRFSGGYANTAFVAMLTAYLEKHKIDPASVRINAGSDPVADLVMRGRLNVPLEEQWKRNRDVIHALDIMGADACFYAIDGRVWHRGGTGAAQELGCTMAMALLYIRALADSPVPIKDWQRHLSFILVAEADQVGTIAKARAARRMWASILDACGLEQTPLRLHMQTSYRMLTNCDPWVNLLRNTVAAFAAGIGGADSITVLPHTKSLGLPDGFARRLARNTQSILLEESQLHQVADPAAGSGAIEARTEALVNAGWDFMQEIERDGGIVKSLEQGKVQERILATRDKRYLDIARRKRPITGVSEFPLLTEKPVAVLPNVPEDLEDLPSPLPLPASGTGERFTALQELFMKGTHLANILQHGLSTTPAITAPPLLETRLSAPYEALRDRVDTAPGSIPVVFLACLGPLAQFTARATWVANAFAAGGIESTGGEPVDSLDDLANAFRQSGAKVACLVSSDKIYAEQAESALKVLKAAGADHLYLAGKPGDQETALAAAGLDTYIYAGCNLLELLQELHDRLGLAADQEALV